MPTWDLSPTRPVSACRDLSPALYSRFPSSPALWFSGEGGGGQRVIQGRAEEWLLSQAARTDMLSATLEGTGALRESFMRSVFLGPRVPSLGALSGRRLEFTVRRHKFNEVSLFVREVPDSLTRGRTPGRLEKGGRQEGESHLSCSHGAAESIAED